MRKLTKVKRDIYFHQQKVYIWFYILKSIFPKVPLSQKYGLSFMWLL